jgi:hypothetical protein
MTIECNGRNMARRNRCTALEFAFGQLIGSCGLRGHVVAELS